MPQRRVSLGFSPLALVALAGVLVPACPCLAAGNSPAPAPPRTAPSAAQKAANNMARQDLHGHEAEALENVYITLALADRDYHGHKGNAMHEVHEAWKILVHNIEHKGTAQQKAQAKHDAEMAVRIKKEADRLPPHHEGQAFSDGQLRQAGAMLGQIAAVLAAHKQPHALGHVKNAIKELDIALRIK
jgi:hypothetical protein